MPAEALRLFYALVPPPPVRHRLASLQEALALSARPVPGANLHVTLAFLGNVERPRLPGLVELGAALAPPRCTLSLDRLGSFPRAGAAWVGSAQPPPELLEFQAGLSARLEALGFQPDRRPWRPHLTLYRKMRNRFAMIDFEPIEWPLNGYCLMRSERRDGAPEYCVEAAWGGT